MSQYQGDVKWRRPQKIRIWECATNSVGNPLVKPPAVLIGEMVGYDFVKDDRWNQWSRPHASWQTFDDYWPQNFFVFSGVSYCTLLGKITYPLLSRQDFESMIFWTSRNRFDRIFWSSLESWISHNIPGGSFFLKSSHYYCEWEHFGNRLKLSSRQ